MYLAMYSSANNTFAKLWPINVPIKFAYDKKAIRNDGILKLLNFSPGINSMMLITSRMIEKSDPTPGDIPVKGDNNLSSLIRLCFT